MMTYIMTLLILIFVTLLFSYIKVLRKIRKYAKQLEGSGYKVFLFPFNPFAMPCFELILKDSKSGDPFESYKNNFVGYDAIVANVFQNPAITFLSPKARKQFVKNQTDFSYHKVPFIVKLKSEVLGKGLVFSEGQSWKRKRRIFSSFFTYQFINNQIPEITKICKKCLQVTEEQYIKKMNKQQSTKQFQFSIFEVGSRMFSSIILTIFLGFESLEQTIDGERICDFILNIVNDHAVRTNEKDALLFGTKILNLGLTARDRDLLRRVKLLNQWASQYIDKLIIKYNQKPNQNQNSLLYLLLKSKNKQNIQQNYTKAELVDELKVFFFAGTDTTSHFLQMMIYYSVKHTEIYKKAQQEVKQINKINGPEQIKKLKYSQAIQKQTIRYYGPLPINFPRVAAKNHYINGVMIQKGTSVDCNSVCTHFDPIYYKNPFQFRPERWLEGNKQIDSICLVGFGMGSRACIGQYLAHVQSKIAFFQILNRYSDIFVPQKLDLVFKFMNEAKDLIVKVVKK